MKKTIYIALGALTILTNLANAASLSPAQDGILPTLSHVNSEEDYHDLHQNITQLIEWSIKKASGCPIGQDTLNNGITERDVTIMQHLPSLNLLDSEDGPCGDMPSLAGMPVESLAGITMTEQEKELWRFLHSLFTSTTVWESSQEGEKDVSIVATYGGVSTRGVLLGGYNEIANTLLLQAFPQICKSVNFEGTMKKLNEKIDAYKASVELFPLAAGAHA